MKNPIKNYKFWIQAVSAAILLAVGIVGIVDKNTLVPIVVMVTGAAILILAIIRFIPLMKTLKANRSRVISIVEFIVNLLVGVILFYGSIMIFKEKDANSGAAGFAKNYYRFFLGGVLYLRALCYFMCTVFYKEETDRIKFWVHIAFITLGVLICTLSSITPQILAFVIAIFALIGSAGLIVDSGFSYGKYRKAIKESRTPKKEEVKDSKDAPAVDDGISKEDIIPNPSIVEDPKDTNQTYVS